jgi:MoaD family protein
MKIEVLYFADIKDITGKDKEIYEVNQNLKDLIELMFNKYNSIKKLLWEDNKNTLKKSIRIAINDEIVSNNDLLNLNLSEGDKLAFLLPLSGG